MQLAANRLRSTSDGIAEISALVGYELAAFSRAFKQSVGTSPSDWRRHHGFAASKEA